tara:strand:+ start:263 stop:577 length:315 start_codon:yes stop_codon:yes gene_type:complete
MTKKVDNGIIREMTSEEQAEYDNRIADWNSKSADRKLAEIREIRNQFLINTDYMANSDYTMPDDVKTWRQTMRDIPANYTTESQYDSILARDSNGNLTHSVWSK